MLTVHKYPLQMLGEEILALPQGAQILHVAEQHGSMQLWALVNPEQAQTEDRVIRVAGTGHPIDDRRGRLVFINTFMMRGGALVFHAFERRNADA